MTELDAARPRTVKYDPITGVPSEFNEFLPKDCEEFKKWKAAQEAAPVAEVGELSLQEKPTEEVEKKLPGGKKKKSSKPEVVLEVSTRSKKKSVTTVLGLELFGVKLADASKLFGKKFAAGASITKNAMDKDQIEVQGDFVDKAAELIAKTYADKGVKRKYIFAIVDKKKEHCFDDEDDADD